jgi:hypothetical protein
LQRKLDAFTLDHSQPWLSRAMGNNPIMMNGIATIIRPQQATNAIHRW